MKDSHETFMQRLIVYGGCVNYFLKRCPLISKCPITKGNGTICKELLERSNGLIDDFRDLPRWKKWILNWLFH